MRFDPKIVEACDEWDDESNELQLPGELAELGDQLHDDALHLARLHPAWPDKDSERQQLASAARSTPRRRRMSTWLGTVSAATALMLIAMGITAYRSAGKSTAKASSEASAEIAAEPAERGPSRMFAFTSLENARASMESNHLSIPPEFVVPRPGPAGPLTPREASMLQTGGPQAEAYLDYIEMTTVRNVKLSF